VVAVASDVQLAGLGVPVLPIDDIPAIAAFVIAHCDLGPAARG
jgi:molybdopterin-guanine dinucleotide biosynthesis protein B